MAELSDEQWAAAEERGRIEMAIKPRALTARFDAESGRVIVDLANGSIFAFPARIAQGLEAASDDQLARVTVTPVGFGLHWEELDVDLRLESLMAGRFGSQRYMIERFGPDWGLAEAA